MTGVTIEQLPLTSREELVELFADAFANQVFMAGVRHERKVCHALMTAFLNYYGGAPSLALHGIYEGQKLVCGAALARLGDDPGGLRGLRFGWDLLRIFGLRTTMSFGKIKECQPSYDGQFLELVLLGTSPHCQAKGLGLEMLKSICAEARRKDYRGVVLVTDPSTPACKFYQKNGFTIDAECPFANSKLVWMSWKC